MGQIRIDEATSVQFPMVKHASDIGWSPVTPKEAELLRQGRENMLFPTVLESKLLEFNPWLNERQAIGIVQKIESLPPTIDGNREVLQWMRGEKQWYDETEQRDRRVQVIDFEKPHNNDLQVTWEWKIEPLTRNYRNRADVIFLVNGIPAAIVEHKNPNDQDALTKAVTQLRRYEKETPELLAQAQLHNETHLIDYWYGVTWNINRRHLFKWKHTPSESYQEAVTAFFDPHDFLRTLQEWILFYLEDGETKKTVLRGHQRHAVDAIVERCADPAKHRGLIWHTQGSGKTFTLLTAAQLILKDKQRFRNATVVLVIDRDELQGQLRDWVDRIFGEMQADGIPVWHANSKVQLQEILSADRGGLVVSMIHKFDGIKKDTSLRDNIYVFIDEAHRSVAKDLGSYLMAALPNSTIIGFTGTPVGGKQGVAAGTFKIFGNEDPNGYLHKYSIVESIKDETTLPIKYMLAPSSMTMDTEELDEKFFALAKDEAITDIDELNKVLKKAVGLRTFLSANHRVAEVAKFAADHFKEFVEPLGYKAFLVAVDRETCAKYKQELDKHFPPGWVEVVYTPNANDSFERPAVAELQLSPEREKEVRRQFKKPDQLPKILIVTDKLLTGYDAPVLYAMYLDKPMRDHVLLQALARVNRPYVDSEGVEKKVGLVVDFVGILKELNKALRFDSADVEGALDDLDIMMAELLARIAAAETEYLYVNGDMAADAALESLVYGRFIDEEQRKKFFENYRQIQNLWEILAPDAELRDYITTYKRLTNLYAAVRNAYAKGTGFTADLEYKTRKLITDNATIEGLGRFTKVATFNVETIEELRNTEGSDEEKVYNLYRGLREDADADPMLQSLRDKADRILKDLEDRKITGLAALDELQVVAAEKEALHRRAEESGLSGDAFRIFTALSTEPSLASIDFDYANAAAEIEAIAEQFPHWKQNSDEERHLRSSLYKPLIKLPTEPRTKAIEIVMNVLGKTNG